MDLDFKILRRACPDASVFAVLFPDTIPLIRILASSGAIVGFLYFFCSRLREALPFW